MIIMRERTVDRYLKHAMDDMLQNNRTEIRFLYRRCKLGTLLNPFSGKLQEHRLMRGSMDSHTQWISDEDDDEVHGAVMCVALTTSWGPQEEGMMSTVVSFPSVRNQGLIDQ
jgi:hypothetical protein